MSRVLRTVIRRYESINDIKIGSHFKKHNDFDVPAVIK